MIRYYLSHQICVSRVEVSYKQPIPAHAVMGIARNNQNSNQGSKSSNFKDIRIAIAIITLIFF